MIIMISNEPILLICKKKQMMVRFFLNLCILVGYFLTFYETFRSYKELEACSAISTTENSFPQQYLLLSITSIFESFFSFVLI